MSWYNERIRHSMSSKGIKTAFKHAKNAGRSFVVIDIDGTLFNVNERFNHAKKVAKHPSPQFWDAFMNPKLVKLDKPIARTADRLKELKKAGHTIIYLSGRRENLMNETNNLLKKYGFPKGKVILRKKGKDTTDMKVDVINSLKLKGDIKVYVGDELRDKKISELTNVPFVRVKKDKQWCTEKWNMIKKLTGGK